MCIFEDHRQGAIEIRVYGTDKEVEQNSDVYFVTAKN